MNREEAQFILGAYRPNSQDAHDPQFQEALALARQDPVLERWFIEQQALDRAFSAKLRSRPIPPDLEKQLLLARSTIRHRPWWRHPGWLATAACLAVLLVASISLRHHRASAHAATAALAEFRTAMARDSLDMSHHFDVVGLDHAGYKNWLVEHRGEAGYVLPPGLADKKISACKIVEWQQLRVTMLCFKVSGHHVDIYVIDASHLPGLRLDSSPAYFADDGVTTAAWRRDGKIYLIAGAMPASDLQQLL